MSQKSEIGKLGEDLAESYLRQNNYIVIDRNFRKPWGELDIIAKEKGGILVFVEVKTMRKNPELEPEENLTYSKLRKLKKTAVMFAGKHPEHIDENLGFRLDLIAIDILTAVGNGKSLEFGKDYLLRHIQNI